MKNPNNDTAEYITACSAAGRLTARIIRPANPVPAPPVVVLHGISRNAGILAQLFAPEAERTGRTIVVPHFPEKSWPDFQRPSKAARPDQALLALLDAVAAKLPDGAGTVDLFGHSGGAQLTHRFAMLYPHRVAALHLVAAGWYCLPDDTMTYPYGLASGTDRFSTAWARRNAHGLRDFLGLPVCVYVGSKDVIRDPALRTNRTLDARQGPNRHARARTYVMALNAAAERHDLPARAQFVELTDCDHDVVHALTHNHLAFRVLDARSQAPRSQAV
ncbi:alpha/beta fold hydrolase [Thiohalorhabdus sp.]|uniref:alpha/beta fold hydrolase n=1 Tax=Thiohalorhabdus sp. TaxID=3094134 RepID=UPI002FC2B8B1